MSITGDLHVILSVIVSSGTTCLSHIGNPVIDWLLIFFALYWRVLFCRWSFIVIILIQLWNVMLSLSVSFDITSSLSNINTLSSIITINFGYALRATVGSCSIFRDLCAVHWTSSIFSQTERRLSVSIFTFFEHGSNLVNNYHSLCHHIRE